MGASYGEWQPSYCLPEVPQLTRSRDDKDVVARIWARVKDHVPEVDLLKNMPQVTGSGPTKRKEVLHMTRLNERMRFLKYTSGQYFRRRLAANLEIVED